MWSLDVSLMELASRSVFSERSNLESFFGEETVVLSHSLFPWIDFQLLTFLIGR